ncbi:hypothetical protein TGPRC2_243615 [Toxoplasma gondii TgCatPRC2]|uniref:Uncharacterized protein n=3 Tax=Toxoplasma gondii TaxID=5811 RepID=A0A151HS50_TOXGO|nr:hypothetical protein TGME49_243615 [Toxoplasma gondii ME49]EPT30491.1 hypothetical protein TGME49_243615 [Toxoplasma gondii ME49]KFG60239.1 hypothetical protein TGRUB_243615 [Toxoplasma gondii RUB]KYK72090.1 hypothetical protein TGPRC2_243615 [Toxoplasma gondii TgCatPRC2]|eukprot:XP_018637518.1 hypothetical protein TGME49_243615 [Toxoplasma gondii ME49]
MRLEIELFQSRSSTKKPCTRFVRLGETERRRKAVEREHFVWTEETHQRLGRENVVELPSLVPLLGRKKRRDGSAGKEDESEFESLRVSKTRLRPLVFLSFRFFAFPCFLRLGGPIPHLLPVTRSVAILLCLY